MSKLTTMREAVASLVPDGASVALGLQMEQNIPFAAGHEIVRQKKRGLRLIGPGRVAIESNVPHFHDPGLNITNSTPASYRQW